MLVQNYTPGMVTCIIPTYKRSNSLLRAVNSVLEQTYKNIEIIIVDDNEPNDKFSIDVQKKLTTIQDKRVKYVQQKKPINGAAARNYGIKHGKGEYIAFLDDDDEWKTLKLEKQVKKIKTLNSTYGAVSCLTSIYKNGEKIRTTPSYTEKELHKKVLEHSVSIFTGTVLFKRTELDKTQYFNEKLDRHQDLQLFTDFLVHSKIKPMNIPLMISHVDDDQNRPNTERLIEVKKVFLQEMESNLKFYSKKEQENILASHYFEIIFSALKERKVKYIIEYLFKIGFNIAAYKKVFKRFYSRIK